MTKGEKAKDALLVAAIQLIAERGDTRKISIRDITAEVGVPPSRIIYYFKSRENFLHCVADSVKIYIQSSPVALFLAKNRRFLESKEGQLFFISGLFHYIRRFFQDVSAIKMSSLKALPILLNSSEISKVVVKSESNPYFRDALAFQEIFEIITGNADKDSALLWYYSVIYPLAKHLGESNCNSGNHSAFMEKENLKFTYFCRKRLIIALGLWEFTNDYSKQESGDEI